MSRIMSGRGHRSLLFAHGDRSDSVACYRRMATGLGFVVNSPPWAESFTLERRSGAHAGGDCKSRKLTPKMVRVGSVNFVASHYLAGWPRR